MPCVWLYRSLPQVSHPWPPRNSGKVNFVATRMPNRTEITKVTSDAKTWARIRAYSIDGSAPRFWVFITRSFRLVKFCAEVVIYPHLRPHSCLDRNCRESRSQRRSGHPATAWTPRGPVENCPILAVDGSLPRLVGSASPDCRPTLEILGDRMSQFPDNWVRWNEWPFRDNPRIAAVKSGSHDPAMHSLLARPAEKPYPRRQPVPAAILQTDGDGRGFPTRQAAYPVAAQVPPGVSATATAADAHFRCYSPYVPFGPWPVPAFPLIETRYSVILSTCSSEICAPYTSFILLTSPSHVFRENRGCIVMYRGEWQTTQAVTNSSRPGPGGNAGSSCGITMV